MISFFVTLARWTASSVTGLRDPEFRAMLFVLIAMLVSSTMFYGSVEGWSVVDSLYCFVMTLGTIGYGDLHPTTDLSKIFTAALLVAGGGVFVRFITKVAALRTARHHRRRNGDDRP